MNDANSHAAGVGMRRAPFIRCGCGRLYEFYSMYYGDQSMCPGCRVRQQRELELAEKTTGDLRRNKMHTFYATEKKYDVQSASTTTMEMDGFIAKLMRAERLKGERVHGLPPGTPIPVFRVDEFPGCPDHWVRARGSYFCPVSEGWGLWYDFRGSPHHTAIVSSTQGVNPVTGQKADELRLEKYVEKCPIHDKEFVGDRLCEECGYTWPCQNYVAPPNVLWWDGWRQQGKVRQFCFTTEEHRIVADQLIGKENTVPAFGFAMFSPVNPPPASAPGREYFVSSWGDSGGLMSAPLSAPSTPTPKGMRRRGRKYKVRRRSASLCTSNQQYCDEIHYAHMEPEQITRSLGVGAGAQINQDLRPDPQDIDWWKPEPSALFRLYFVFEGEFARIVHRGHKDLSGASEGFLGDIPVG